ncbi:uncharacterized protein LOC144706742 [Wolffia australiana]
MKAGAVVSCEGEDMDKAVRRQMGCMAGFLQIFDRHQIYAARRLGSFPSPAASCSSASERSESSISSSFKDEIAGRRFPPSKPLPVFEVSQGRSSWKLREAPRLSLDSKLSPRGNESTRSDPPTRSPSVVAKLMGLDALPSDARQPQLRRSVSASRVDHLAPPTPSDLAEKLPAAVRSPPPPPPRRQPAQRKRFIAESAPRRRRRQPAPRDSPVAAKSPPSIKRSPRGRRAIPAATSDVAAFTIKRRVVLDGLGPPAEEQQPSPVSVLDGGAADTWRGFVAAAQRRRECDVAAAEGQKVRRRRRRAAEEGVCAVLWGDLAEERAEWAERSAEVSDAVLAVERLLFKDLVSDLIRNLAAAVDWRRRRPVPAPLPRRRLLF